MPFGSHPFQDEVHGFYEELLEAGVTNAFRQSSVSGQPDRPLGCSGRTGSPMPFGSHPFQDVVRRGRLVPRLVTSPMPFGSHPFQDRRAYGYITIHDSPSPMPFGSHPFQD